MKINLNYNRLRSDIWKICSKCINFTEVIKKTGEDPRRVDMEEREEEKDLIRSGNSGCFAIEENNRKETRERSY